MLEGGEAQKLASYINGLHGFVFENEMGTYQHIGATLTDVIFQPGINYHTAVEPRVKKIKGNANASTISGLQFLFRKNNAEEFFNWKGRKPRGFLGIVSFLAKEEVETEEDLKSWLLVPGNPERLKLLSGFSDKTIDYLKILVGIQSVAVDRHLITMLERAEINCEEYEERKTVLMGAAQILNVNPSALDHSIWRYINKENEKEDDWSEEE
jgi:hypothetical protein